MSLGSLFRRVEQNLLQGMGLVQSSLSADASFARDEARAERVDSSARAMVAALSSYLAALRRSAEASTEYVTVLERAIASAGHGSGPNGGGSGSSGGGAAPPTTARLDLKPLARLIHAQRAAVIAPTERALAEGLARGARLQRAVAGVRAEMLTRKDRILDHDSYVRRTATAEQGVASARDPASIAEAREALRKVEGKARDAAATVNALTGRIRARLGELEDELASAASESALAFLAAQAHTASHAGEAARALAAAS
jgi:hypothetical protein